MVNLTTYTESDVMDLLNTIPDPEVPAISIVELGVVRKVEKKDSGFTIVITPTYSGCPALNMMKNDIQKKLTDASITHSIEISLHPAWTTEWMSNEVKQKLKEYGIAPPRKRTGLENELFSQAYENINCPFCQSSETKLESIFGSTACKSLHYCNHCHQPFEHFKCH